MDRFKFVRKVWVLDSQWKDSASFEKTRRLIEIGETVFIWPEYPGREYKDINDVCVAAKKDALPVSFFVKNTICIILIIVGFVNISVY